MLPSCLSLASRAILITFALLFLGSSSDLQIFPCVQASPTSTLTPISNPFPKSVLKPSDYASTSGTKPVPEAPYLYSWSSGSSRAPSPSHSSTSPTGRSAGPHKPRIPGNGSPPMSDRPFKYIDLTEFRHLLTQPALPEHQRPRPKRTRTNAPWKKGKGVLEGPLSPPASSSPKSQKKATGRLAHSLEADVREDPPEMPVGKNVGKTRGGLWRKMAGCFRGCSKKG